MLAIHGRGPLFVSADSRDYAFDRAIPCLFLCRLAEGEMFRKHHVLRAFDRYGGRLGPNRVRLCSPVAGLRRDEDVGSREVSSKCGRQVF